MNPTKKQILHGEELLKKDSEILQRISNVDATHKEIQAALCCLYAERVRNVEARLEGLQKKYEVEFERESAECNGHLYEIIAKAKKYVDMDPVAISDKIKAILEKYESAEDPPEQEERNDDFYELLKHMDFFEKRVKGNGNLKVVKK